MTAASQRLRRIDRPGGILHDVLAIIGLEPLKTGGFGAIF